MSTTATKSLGLLGVLCVLSLVSLQAQQTTYETLKAAAETYYAEGSYQLAYEAYLKAKGFDLSVEEKRWVDSRLADTLWRSHALSQSRDETNFDQARRQLEALITEIEASGPPNQLCVEAHESLGHLFWTTEYSYRSRCDRSQWDEAWAHYEKALDWWANSYEVELARERFLEPTFSRRRGRLTRSLSGFHCGWKSLRLIALQDDRPSPDALATLALVPRFLPDHPDLLLLPLFRLFI